MALAPRILFFRPINSLALLWAGDKAILVALMELGSVVTLPLSPTQCRWGGRRRKLIGLIRVGEASGDNIRRVY